MIPNIVHLCFGMAADFGGKPWSLVHYACVRSMVERLKPDAIFLYHRYPPRGPWWSLTEPLVTLVPIEPPASIFGNRLMHPAHVADVVRLEKLIAHGGIYLDCDVLVMRDFDALRRHRCVIGQQGEDGRYGLCNAVILAEPGASFLRRWYDSYRTFRSRGRDDFWSEHSTRVPLRLLAEDSSDITVLDHTAFHWPLWNDEHIAWIYDSCRPVETPDAFAHHLWETCAWAEYLDGLDVRRVRAVDTNFHRWIRPLLRDLPDDFAVEPAWRTACRALRRSARRTRAAFALSRSIA